MSKKGVMYTTEKKATVFHDLLDSTRLACAAIRPDSDDDTPRQPMISLSISGEHEPTHLDGNRLVANDGRDTITLFQSGVFR
jgi:hypothetical protein